MEHTNTTVVRLDNDLPQGLAVVRQCFLPLYHSSSFLSGHRCSKSKRGVRSVGCCGNKLAVLNLWLHKASWDCLTHFWTFFLKTSGWSRHSFYSEVIIEETLQAITNSCINVCRGLIVWIWKHWYHTNKNWFNSMNGRPSFAGWFVAVLIFTRGMQDRYANFSVFVHCCCD